ncbi:MAG TPA: PEP-CTERM sorting domain-containing protein [Gemmatimonadaceae bacterium]|nr:PEP-CTERM sorting domain-containing protein [Gemmatimonadaceae bacterium]
MRSSTPTRHAARAALALVAAAAATTLAPPAAAQIAPGSTLVFSGTADAIDVGSAGVLLDFGQHVIADPSANTGTFASLNKPRTGAVGSIETITVGSGPQPVRKFVQFGPYKFDLTAVPSGPYGQDACYVEPVVGQRCTPFQLPSFTLSPFYLENLASSGSDGMFTALVSFDVIGTVTAHGTTTDFTGTITATFDGVSFQEALAGLEQFGLEDVPFTATFVTGGGVARASATTLMAAEAAVVPEPSTAALVAIGLAGVAGVARRRARARLRGAPLAPRDDDAPGRA